MKYVLAVALDVIGILFFGCVLKVLWGWFVVGTFGLPMLSVPVAIGIGIIVGLLTYKNSDVLFEDFEDIVKRWVRASIIMPLTSLIIGFIVHLFM